MGIIQNMSNYPGEIYSSGYISSDLVVKPLTNTKKIDMTKYTQKSTTAITTIHIVVIVFGIRSVRTFYILGWWDSNPQTYLYTLRIQIRACAWVRKTIDSHTLFKNPIHQKYDVYLVDMQGKIPIREWLNNFTIARQCGIKTYETS